MIGTCPVCMALVKASEVEMIDRDPFTGRAWRGVLLRCPECDTTMGSEMAPLSQSHAFDRADTASEDQPG